MTRAFPREGEESKKKKKKATKESVRE